MADEDQQQYRVKAPRKGPQQPITFEKAFEKGRFQDGVGEIGLFVGRCGEERDGR